MIDIIFISLAFFYLHSRKKNTRYRRIVICDMNMRLVLYYYVLLSYLCILPFSDIFQNVYLVGRRLRKELDLDICETYASSVPLTEACH